MKICFILVLFSINLTFSQQVSKSIPFGNKTQESGWSIRELDGDFIITFSVRCKIDKNVPSEYCCAMIRINKFG